MPAETSKARNVVHVIVPQREGAIGGADLHVLDLARQQRETGWHPWVLAPRAPNQYVRLLCEAGVDVLVVPMHRLLHLARIPRHIDFDIVHAHGYESNYLVAALRLAVPSWRRIPTVTTAHGWIETGLWLRMKSMLDRLTARTAHVRIASAQAHAVRMWSGRGKNFVVHNGVRSPSEGGLRQPSAAIGASAPRDLPATFVVGSVGRLSPEKRVDLFLVSAAKTVAAGHDVQFAVVGGGHERARLEELVVTLGLEGRVSFTGLVDDPGQQYAEMDVLVQASDTEGTPRTVIEAMARGLPVVATDVGDVAELLDHGASGLLVPTGDADAMSAAIQLLLADRGLATEIAARAEARYRERFTINVMAKEVERCYEAAIGCAGKQQRGRKMTVQTNNQLVRFPDPHPDNVAAALARINDGDSVLDVGGWWKPLNRADHVVDLLPYESRAGGGKIGPGPERYSADTWHQFDICKTPWPFPDKAFDFVYCGQTLEDIRDPIAVCEELSRVAKRGYVEVPSVWIECTYDIDVGPLTPRYPGYEKHRWLVLEEESELLFVPKQVWLSLVEFIPRKESNRWRRDQRIWTTAVHWEGSISARELAFSGHEDIIPLLCSYFEGFDYSCYVAGAGT
jgi:glycosyltransferase involved in cell wall biosynthesis